MGRKLSKSNERDEKRYTSAPHDANTDNNSIQTQYSHSGISKIEKKIKKQ